MGCGASTPTDDDYTVHEPPPPAVEMPESVMMFFNGAPMAGKADTFMGEKVADSFTLEFVGPHVHQALVGAKLDKAKFGFAAKNLIDSFPDLTFNSTKVEPKCNLEDGSWAANIVVKGTHTGAAFTPMPNMLPAIETTNKLVKLGPETFTLWTDRTGKVSKVEIRPSKGHPHGPAGFYLEVGGVFPPPPVAQPNAY